MALRLTVENVTSLPDGGPLAIEVSGRRGIDIGRDQYLDWVLPDPSRTISGRHCEVRFHDEGYWLHDVSRNGTFLNRNPQRLQEPHRLRDGDRVEIGSYVIAVRIDGDDASGPAAPSPAPRGPEEYWTSGEDAAPAISPRDLRPHGVSAPVNPDFSDWRVDVDAPVETSRSGPPPSSWEHVEPGPIGDDMGWARGSAPLPLPPIPPIPNPRRPGQVVDGTPPPEVRPAPVTSGMPGAPGLSQPAQASGEWHPPAMPERVNPFADGSLWPDALGENGANPVAQHMPPPNVGAGLTERIQPPQEPPTRADPETETPHPNGEAAEFVERFAKGARLPAEALAWRDPGDLAEEIGELVRLSTDSLKQLLAARAETKRVGRTAHQTTIQALDNNPLKFSPTVEDALRIMFGRPSSGYLEARRALEDGFRDLKTHQVKTYSAMQHALRLLLENLDPDAIEQSVENDRGLGALLGSRKARLWDIYTTRWDTLAGPQEDSLTDAFMIFFADCYDRGEKGR